MAKDRARGLDVNPSWSLGGPLQLLPPPYAFGLLDPIPTVLGASERAAAGGWWAPLTKPKLSETPRWLTAFLFSAPTLTTS